MHISVWTATADMILKSHPVAGVGVDESTGSALAPRAANEKGSGKECCSTSNGICVALPSASNGRALPQVAAEQPSSLRPLCASAPCPPNLRGGGKTIDERINTLLHVLDEFQEAGEAASAHRQLDLIHSRKRSAASKRQALHNFLKSLEARVQKARARADGLRLGVEPGASSSMRGVDGDASAALVVWSGIPSGFEELLRELRRKGRSATAQCGRKCDGRV